MQATKIDSTTNFKSKKNTKWQLWCRLCSKTNEERKIGIFCKDEKIEVQDGFIDVGKLKYKILEINEGMLQYFHINLSQNDKAANYLCGECYSLLVCLKKFSEIVNKVQMMFQYLQKEDQNINGNLQAIREKFGLNEDAYSFQKLLDGFQFDSSLEREKENNKNFEVYNSVEVITNNENINMTNLKSKESNSNTDSLPASEMLDTCKFVENNETDMESESEISTYDDDSSDADYAQNKVGNKSFACDRCKKTFGNARDCRTHKRNEHLKDDFIENQEKYKREQVFKCKYCLKNFKTNTTKEFHVRTIHLQQKSYVCEKCGVGMSTLGSLKEHMLTHSDYAPFQCEICQKNFKQRQRLKRHMETHDPNKYICAQCGKELNSRSTLNRHLLVHTDELSHKCEYCGRAFKRSRTLKNHLILHTGLRPYVCDFCGSTFAQGSSCRAHKKRAHPKELAAQEAAGVRPYTKNIPNITALKAL